MILRKIKIILCIYLPYLNFYRNLNIYSATVPDRMHHLDLGLFRYQIEYTYELLKSQHNNIIVNELDRCLSVIPHYTGLKIKLPKLHSWMYHIIDSIRLYGAVNGYTTETYESLHKDFVKTPYRLSNKKNIETQLLQTVSI